METEDNKYPENTKLNNHIDKISSINEFLEFCRENYVYLYSNNETLEPFILFNSDIIKLINEFIGIDENKLEQERRAMLEECRKLNK